MALDFGLIGQENKVQTADYKSAGSHQAENVNMELVTDANTWEEIYTVPDGKTYYISAIFISTEVAGPNTMQIGTGASAAEVAFFIHKVGNTLPFDEAMPTPLKISSGTRLAVRTDTDSDVWFVLVGWEE